MTYEFIMEWQSIICCLLITIVGIEDGSSWLLWLSSFGVLQLGSSLATCRHEQRTLIGWQSPCRRPLLMISHK